MREFNVCERGAAWKETKGTVNRERGGALAGASSNNREGIVMGMYVVGTGNTKIYMIFNTGEYGFRLGKNEFGRRAQKTKTWTNNVLYG